MLALKDEEPSCHVPGRGRKYCRGHYWVRCQGTFSLCSAVEGRRTSPFRDTDNEFVYTHLLKKLFRCVLWSGRNGWPFVFESLKISDGA